MERDSEEEWEEKYAALQRYRAKHGNCGVPWGKEHGALRSWMERQKQLRTESKLEEDKVKKLDSLGFDWAHAGSTNNPPAPVESADDIEMATSADDAGTGPTNPTNSEAAHEEEFDSKRMARLYFIYLLSLVALSVVWIVTIVATQSDSPEGIFNVTMCTLDCGSAPFVGKYLFGVAIAIGTSSATLLVFAPCATSILSAIIPFLCLATNFAAAMPFLVYLTKEMEYRIVPIVATPIGIAHMFTMFCGGCASWSHEKATWRELMKS